MKIQFRSALGKSATRPCFNPVGTVKSAWRFVAFAMTVLLLLCGANSRAELPITGRRVETLTDLDARMKNYMNDHGICAGVLGVMKDGRIVYLRGFGYCFDGTTPLPENALFRLASCTKPITVAAARQLIAAGRFNLTSNAFNLGQAGGGLLDARAGGEYEPFPALWGGAFDSFGNKYSHADIQVQHLIAHTGGWEHDPDLTREERTIAAAMGTGSPPGRTNTVKYILGQPLQFEPGNSPSSTPYSNEGYLALGLIVEQYSGMDLVSYIRSHVLTPDMWVPKTDIKQGRTFRKDYRCNPPAISSFQDEREPFYESSGEVTSVFDGCEKAPDPYGGWDHEARVAQGGLIASAATMLEFLNRYNVGCWHPDIGQPLSSFPLTVDESKDGSLTGINTYAVQRTDGVNVFIAFNKKSSSGYAIDFYNDQLDSYLDTLASENFAWPKERCDGFWIEPGSNSGGGVGGYEDPFLGLGAALDYVKDGSKLRLKGGTSTWTGTITTRVLIDAPHETAIIGLQ
jgi:hypothetical protein